MMVQMGTGSYGGNAYPYVIQSARIHPKAGVSDQEQQVKNPVASSCSARDSSCS